MYMKPNKAGKNMWLRAQIENQNFKQKTQTQDAHDMQTFLCVIYDTVRGYISQLVLLIWAPSAQPPRVRWGFRHGTCSTLKLKLFDISRRSHPMKFFFNNFSMYL